MDELLEQFMIEGRELISTATDDLLALEEDMSAPGRVESAFRAVHTLKGSVAIFDLAPMGIALHAAEDLLASVRSAGLSVDATIAQALLGCLDQCDRWMDAMAESGALPPEAPKHAVKIANGLVALAGGADGETSQDQIPQAIWVADLVERNWAIIREAGSASSDLTAVRYTPAEDCFFTGDDPMALVSKVPGLLALNIAPRERWPTLEDFDPYRCNMLIELLSSANASDLQQIFRFIPDQVEISSVASLAAKGQNDSVPLAGAGAGAEAQRTVRVDAVQIDKLLDLLGQLMVAKNGLAHLANRAERGMDCKIVAADIRSAQASTDRLLAEMHENVMTLRMVSLDRVFRRLTRMVRELCERLGRDVAVDVAGAGTRVDKAVADALFEPLLHIVRNAIDHGVETPECRQSVGKEGQGKLKVSARSLGNEIAIEISDDGAGIDASRIREAAVEREVGSAEDLRMMDDNDALQLIFAPGFSTARAVTDVSGRGIGLDAVKTAIERLGGRVSVASQLGQGTKVSLRLPATAALTTILVVRVGENQFGIPLDLVVETVRIPRNAIIPVGLGNAFVLRDRTLPLAELAALLGIEIDRTVADAKILVVDAVQGRIGIVVDDFSERLEVMLRPMAGLLANVPGVTGTTLLGDGSVLLILDIAELIG